MGWTSAVMTSEEVGAILDWLAEAIAESEGDSSCGDLGKVNATYWFNSPTALRVFEGKPCIAAKTFRLIQRAAPPLGFLRG